MYRWFSSLPFLRIPVDSCRNWRGTVKYWEGRGIEGGTKDRGKEEGWRGEEGQRKGGPHCCSLSCVSGLFSSCCYHVGSSLCPCSMSSLSCCCPILLCIIVAWAWHCKHPKILRWKYFESILMVHKFLPNYHPPGMCLVGNIYFITYAKVSY